jgi:hypothetical protein
MNTNTKTILIVSSVIALGGIAYLVVKGGNKKSSLSNEIKDFTQLPIEQPTKTNVLGSLGIEVPKLKPLVLPSFKEIFKGTNWLKIGEQVKTTNTTTSTNYGIDNSKLADLGLKYGNK